MATLDILVPVRVDHRSDEQPLLLLQDVVASFSVQEAQQDLLCAGEQQEPSFEHLV